MCFNNNYAQPIQGVERSCHIGMGVPLPDAMEGEQEAASGMADLPLIGVVRNLGGVVE